MKSYKANKKQQPRSLIHESDTAVLVSVYFLIAIFHMSIKWKASGSWVMSVNQSVEQQWYCHQDVQSLWITCKVQQRGWFVLGKWRVPFKISEKLKQKLPVFKHQNRISCGSWKSNNYNSLLMCIIWYSYWSIIFNLHLIVKVSASKCLECCISCCCMR